MPLRPRKRLPTALEMEFPSEMGFQSRWKWNCVHTMGFQSRWKWNLLDPRPFPTFFKLKFGGERLDFFIEIGNFAKV